MQLRFVHKQRYAWVKYLVRTEGFMLAKPKKNHYKNLQNLWTKPEYFPFSKKKYESI